MQRIQRRYGNWDIVEEGSAFRREWFVHFADGAPARARRVRFWDFAATQNGGDYTVGTKLAFSEGRYFVEDVVRVQYGPGEVRKLVQATALRDGREVAIRMEQEPGSAGKSIIHNYVNMLAGFDAKGIPATGAKQTRWRPFAGQCESGAVVVCNGRWVEDWLDELCTVPESEHDDQADSVSGTFRCLSEEVQPYFGVDFLGRSGGDSPSFGKVR